MAVHVFPQGERSHRRAEDVPLRRGGGWLGRLLGESLVGRRLRGGAALLRRRSPGTPAPPSRGSAEPGARRRVRPRTVRGLLLGAGGASRRSRLRAGRARGIAPPPAGPDVVRGRCRSSPVPGGVVRRLLFRRCGRALRGGPGAGVARGAAGVLGRGGSPLPRGLSPPLAAAFLHPSAAGCRPGVST